MIRQIWKTWLTMFILSALLLFAGTYLFQRAGPKQLCAAPTVHNGITYESFCSDPSQIRIGFPVFLKSALRFGGGAYDYTGSGAFFGSMELIINILWLVISSFIVSLYIHIFHLRRKSTITNGTYE